MNVLGICLSPGKGGLELYASKAINALKNAGHECHFVVAPDNYIKDQIHSIRLIEIKPLFHLLPLLSARKLAKNIDANGIDVIHMHWSKDLNLSVLAKIFSRRKPKLVYTRHMEITRSKKDPYHRFMYKQVDRMLVIAEFVRKQAIRYLPLSNDQISLLYLGVEAAEIATPEQCAKLIPNLADKQRNFVIGMIGRIETFKGQHVLLDALNILKSGKIYPTVCMAGPVMDDAYFKKLMSKIKESNLDEKVTYIGVSKEPARLMSCCDVVVLTTYCETFGLVLVEAMRVGTAVIGTNAGGVPEIIRHGETGMLYAPGNAQELADRLAELMQDPVLCKRLADSGKAFADTMFDDTRHFSQLTQILSELSSANS